MINTGIIDYLRSSLGFASRKRAMASMAILFLWLAVVIFTSSRHELWRDEVRALSIALQPESFWQLPMVLRNEGHPILWYLILRSGYLSRRPR